MNKTSRRTFIFSLFILVSSFFLSNRFRRASRSNLIGLILEFREDFTNHFEAILLGKAYLNIYPHEKDGKILTACILDNLAINTFNIQTKKMLLLELQNSINKDFNNGQIVNLNGWILSKTEGRLFALSVPSVVIPYH